MNKWVEKRLGEVAPFKYGKALLEEQRQMGTYKVYSSAGTCGFSDDTLASQGIIIGRKGTAGSVFYSPVPFFCIDTAFYIDEIVDDCNMKFIYYYMQLMNLGSFNNDAAVPGLNRNLAHKLKIRIPDLPTQTRIASILSAYDDAIENNNRRVALLEKVARELYREWFLRFRFPGHEKAKLVNGLPEGWERAKFKDNISYLTGKLDSNEMVADGKYSFYTCAKTIYKTNTYCYDGECVLLGGNNATGDFSLFYANEKLNAYQRTYIITPLNNRLSCPYIYFMLEDYLQHFKVSSTGAATKFLTKRILDNVYIILPLQELSNEYKRIAKTLFDEIINLQSQSQNLARQRDLLLPRLMSGKLEV